jgi:hypothetical protein
MFILDVACLAPLADRDLHDELRDLRQYALEDSVVVHFHADRTNRSDMRVVRAVAEVWPGADVRLFDGP